jgi:deoxycytidylate deaminase
MASKKYSITAIIYDKKGNVLSIGKNSYTKTHPIQAKHAELVGEPHKIFLHAEMDAIIKCRDIDKAYKIVVLRTEKDGTYANSCPCKICQHAISLTPIKIIEHS